MKWADKLTEIRNDLETMVDRLNKRADYTGAMAAMEALQKVARIDNNVEDGQLDMEWKP